MQPYCMIGNELDAVEPTSGFDSIVKTESSQGSMSSSFFNYLEAPYLSVSPMLALSDSFEVKSDEDESVDLNLDVSLQIRQFNQLEAAFATSTDNDFRECSSVDQCNTFDQIHSNWSEFNVPDFLLGYDISNSKSRCCADPTLAELNANGKSLFDDLTSSDCLPISEECSQFIFPTAPTSPQDSQDALILPTVASVCNGLIQNALLPNLGSVKIENPDDCGLRRSALQDLLLQNNCSFKRRSSPSPEIKTDIKLEPNDCEELPEFSHCIKRRQRTSTVSSTSSACESQPGTSSDITHRFGNESHYDYSTDKQDSDSNEDSLDSDGDYSNQSNYRSDEEKNFVVTRQRSRSMSTGDSRIKRRNKRGRFFWQYNLQSKGPKGNRLPLTTEFSNPHKLEQVTDPVFSPRCIIKGIKHTGKARKGDGNDLTPNPGKLHQIGQSLKHLNQIINDLTPVNELPVNVRPKSRKEKNKLASRVCRLKKKAQHEANKIKSFGLEHEHEQLLYILNEMKNQVKDASYKNKPQLLERCCSMEKELIKVKVAGRSVDFVNEILDKFATGIPSGGLDEL